MLELEREGVLEILQVKNRFLTGAHGYKDININIRFEALICEARACAARGDRGLLREGEASHQ